MKLSNARPSSTPNAYAVTEVPSSPSDTAVDVAVIGAGVAGLIAALHMRRAGLDVAVIDAKGVAGGATAFTTAHLAEAFAAPYEHLTEASADIEHLAGLPELALAGQDPRACEQGLTLHLRAAGVHVHERALSLHLHEGARHQVVTERGVLRPAHVVFATDGAHHARFSPSRSRSYLVAFETRDPVPEGLFWDTESPFLYVRTQHVGSATMLLVGGADRESDPEPDPSDRHERLAEWARARFDIESLHFMWSSQTIVENDGRPYIGASPHASSTYVATGYPDDGLTLGTLAARVVSDAIRAQKTSFALTL